MAEIKKEFKFFTATDYGKQETYLRERHRSGWRFADVNLPGIFRFESCPPEDMIYKLEPRPQSGGDESAFRASFAAHGWEYVLSFGEYSIFRKPAADRTDGDKTPFTPVLTRLNALRRTLYRQTIPVLVILVLFLPSHIRYIRDSGPGSPAVIAVTVLWYALLLVYALIMARSWVSYYGMWKKHLTETR